MSSTARSTATSPGPASWTATAVAELERLCGEHRCAARPREPLSRHTSMGVGGTTPLMVWPSHPEMAATLLAWCAARGLRWRVLGGGTNIFVPDRGVAEPVVNLCRLIEGLRIDAPAATFPAGLPTAQAMRISTRAGLAGLVWSTGLPGTIGGAAAGNAGCWGGEMGAAVVRLDIVDASGRWQALPADDLDWGYRSLDLERVAGTGAVIVAVTMELGEGDPVAMRERVEELQRIKRQRQPVGARNAGCIFKNPEVGPSAGRLIDEAGCKGMRVGDAEVSTLHGNFVINRGRATAADVDRLIEAVKLRVRERHGAGLEEEIRRW